MRSVRLMVVEDNPAYLYLIRKAFETQRGETRWILTAASDGEEALRLLFEEEDENVPLPELILLDWNLPRTNGEEVLRRVKEHPELRMIPVLIFSTSEAKN